MIAGDEGLEVLAFSSGSETRLTWLPRPNATFRVQQVDYWDGEA